MYFQVGGTIDSRFAPAVRFSSFSASGYCLGIPVETKIVPINRNQPTSDSEKSAKDFAGASLAKVFYSPCPLRSPLVENDEKHIGAV